MSDNTTRHPVRLLTIDSGNAGQRIDNFLLTALKGVPRSLVYRLLRTGQVRVNKGRIKQTYRLQLDDIVRVPPVSMPSEGAQEAPSKGLCNAIAESIIFEDDNLIIIDKPSGIAVHGGSGIANGVIEIMRVIRSEEKDLELVHRLDRQTSGCLLLAKNRPALLELHELLRENLIDKRYFALVQGYWQDDESTVNFPLLKERAESGLRTVKVSKDGQASTTQFSVKRHFDHRMTLLEAKPLTGRMHQIRVHAAHSGHPILGDEVYGKRTLNRELKKQGLKRLFLHAHTLSFMLPSTMKKISVSAPLSLALEKFLNSLENGADNEQ